VAYSSMATARTVGAVVIGPMLVLQFISGVYIAFDTVPQWLQQVASLFPLKWIAQGMRSVFYPSQLASAEMAGGWETGRTVLVLTAWAVGGRVKSAIVSAGARRLVLGLASWLTRETGIRDVYEISTRETVTGLQEQAPVRFRAAWQWKGGPAVLQSRATDDTGMVQPTRAQFADARGLRGVYHYNAIASWRIDEKGEASNVYV